MTSPMNVYNQDGFPSIANALLFGTTLVPLNQSTATTGFIPQIQTNGGLTLTAPSGLGITWANALTAGNTSGANDAIMSAGQALNFADGTVKINGTVGGTNSIAVGNAAVGVSTRDIAFGSSATTTGTAGSAQERIAIGVSATAGAGSVNYSIALGSLASSTATSSIAIGRAATATGLNSVSIGSTTTSLASADVAIGQNCAATGAGAHSRISIGQDCIAGAAGQFYSIAVGSQSNSTSTNTIAIGRLTSATHTNSVALGVSAATTATNQIMLGNNATGGLTQIYGSVGANGRMESAGYLVSFNQVRAAIRPTAGQAIVSGAGATVIDMATVTYTSDYGTPAITSVASQLQTRANRCMTGFLNMIIVFNAPPAANGFITTRIMKNTNGVNTIMAVHSYYVLAGLLGYSVSIPFSDYNAATPAPNVYYFCDTDNPALFGQIYTVQTTTHFVGQMTN